MDKIFKNSPSIRIKSLINIDLGIFCIENRRRIGIFALGTALCITPMSMAQLIAEEQPVEQKSDTEEKDLKTLQLELQNLNRELHNYKARLFRSSHPKDQDKIADLGKVLSEKETLNKKLLSAVDNLEKELSTTKKQSVTNERATEALTTLIENQRDAAEAKAKEYEQKINDLKLGIDSQRNDFLLKLKECQLHQEQMAKEIEQKQQVIQSLQNQLLDHKSHINNLSKEIDNASQSFCNKHEEEKKQLSCQTQAVFEHLQATEMASNSHRTELEEQIFSLNKQVDKEKLYFESVEDEIRAAKEDIANKERRLQELEQSHADSLAFAAELTHRLENSQSQHTEAQEKLTATLHELEMTKNSLIEELKLSKEDLEKRSAALEAMEQQYAEIAARYEAQQQRTESIEHDFTNLQNEITTLEAQLTEARHTIASHEEKHQQHSNQISSLSSELSQKHDHLSRLEDEKSQLVAALKEKEKLEEELASYKAQAHTLEMSEEVSRDQLLATIEEDKITMAALMERMEKLVLAQQEANYREQEMEHSLRLLTVLAENQDKSLSAASTAMAKSQEYSRLLEHENNKLKDQIVELEMKQNAINARNMLKQADETADRGISPFTPIFKR